VSGKDIISSMNEFRDIYMRDYFKNNDKTNTETESDFSNNDLIDKSYLEVRLIYFVTKSVNFWLYKIINFKRKLLPEQPINREEVQTLVENDWLVKSNKSDQEETQKESK
jgi:hypothetical protein